MGIDSHDKVLAHDGWFHGGGGHQVNRHYKNPNYKDKKKDWDNPNQIFQKGVHGLIIQIAFDSLLVLFQHTRHNKRVALEYDAKRAIY